MLTISGDFTFWRYLKNLSGRDFERTLGFHGGRLSDGFGVIVMVPEEVLSVQDFWLQASTRWSGNKIGPTKEQFETILSRRGVDPQEKRHQVMKFFRKSYDNLPAKVISNQEHRAGMSYPNAEALAGIPSGVPSFHLRSPKRAILARIFGPDYKLVVHRHPNLPHSMLFD